MAIGVDLYEVYFAPNQLLFSLFTVKWLRWNYFTIENRQVIIYTHLIFYTNAGVVHIYVKCDVL